MKVYHQLTLVLILLFSFRSSDAQNGTKLQVQKALTLWNDAAKHANLEKFMSFFDESENIMLVGSDSGEIFKGKKQIRSWLGGLFEHHSFQWEMNRIDIDSYQNTAWVFVDGAMIVTNDKGNRNKTPYRFSGVLIKKGNQWKWRLFDGSIPKGE